mgnify:CR=1 FL=1
MSYTKTLPQYKPTANNEGDMGWKSNDITLDSHQKKYSGWVVFFKEYKHIYQGLPYT